MKITTVDRFLLGMVREARRTKPRISPAGGGSWTGGWATWYKVADRYEKLLRHTVKVDVKEEPLEVEISCDCSQGQKQIPCMHLARVIGFDNELERLLLTRKN